MFHALEKYSNVPTHGRVEWVGSEPLRFKSGKCDILEVARQGNRFAKWDDLQVQSQKHEVAFSMFNIFNEQPCRDPAQASKPGFKTNVLNALKKVRREGGCFS